VRRADARSAQIGGPDGISCCFQVSAYSGEPLASIARRNLLSKDRCRAALGDEAVKSGPEVSLIGMALALSCARKRLTGTGAGPDGAAPAGELERVGPAADAGEEVALVVSGEIAGTDIGDATLVHVAVRNKSCCIEGAEPFGGGMVNLVVVGGHGQFC
jgi:hypothetical protein